VLASCLPEAGGISADEIVQVVLPQNPPVGT